MSEDLIKRSDAIKAYNKAMSELVKWQMEEWQLGDFSECEFNTTDCKHIVRKIEAIPSADRPQGWIPCSERLPREYEVLCCDIYKNCIVGHPFADDSASTGFCAESEGEFMYECVAWMPLPEPWKGEQIDEID